jgi:hypothetical protein
MRMRTEFRSQQTGGGPLEGEWKITNEKLKIVKKMSV